MHLRMLVDPIQRPYRVAVPPGVPGRQPIAPPDLCVPAHVRHYLTTWSLLIRIGLNIYDVDTCCELRTVEIKPGRSDSC